MADNVMHRWDRQREHRFFSTIAIAAAIVVFFGFARSFFLRPLFPEIAGLAAPEPFFYVHGIVFSAWMLLLVAQTTLIRTGNRAMHMRLGTAGIGLAVLIVAFGLYGSLLAAGRPGGFIGVPIPPLAFLSVPIFDMLMFGLFVTLGFLARQNPQSHKRYMLIATINMLQAAIVRVMPPVLFDVFGPLAPFFLADLFIVAMVIYDLLTHRRVHIVTLWAGVATIVSQPLRLVVGQTDAWQGFASFAVGLAG